MTDPTSPEAEPLEPSPARPASALHYWTACVCAAVDHIRARRQMSDAALEAIQDRVYGRNERAR